MRETANMYDFTVTWKPFQLRPHMPPEGVAKPPQTPENPRCPPRMKAVGKSVGIDFTGLTDRYPNTLLAHILLDYALKNHGPEVQDHLQEVLFRHYFTDGRYPDAENLRLAAEEVGIADVDGAMEYVLNNRKAREAVQREASDASREGISGVPYFKINGQEFGSGAHPPSAFVQAFAAFAPPAKETGPICKDGVCTL